MSSEWQRFRLEDVALPGKDGLVDGPFGSNLPSSAYTPEGIPVIRGSNLTKGEERFRSHEFVYVSSETADKLSRSLCLPNDIIFTKKGTLGQIGLVPAGPHPVYLLSSNQMRMRVDGKRADAEFVYYYLAQRESIEKIIRDSEHTGVPKINLGYLRSFPIVLPEVSTQRAIASALSTFDDRIALLRETNATLEAIAQALFKSWFVDFDPVRAKREGRAPEGMDEATAGLFPDSFEDSELGKVPRGWEVQAIGDCINTVGGATPDTKNAAFWSPEEFAWTTPKDLSGATSPALISTERKLSAAGLAKISCGLLPKGSLLMSSRAPIGYLAIADLPVAINQGYIGMLPGGRLPPLYMLRWCEAHMDQIKGRANGSTFMEISKKAFRPIPAVVPDKAVIAAYMAVAQPLFDRVIANEWQALTLIQVRDTLLPRLISGQLRLPEPHSLLEATA
ncbi:restriction endonuclease subunit S [Roseateles toxinivorans]|uniref:Type I restriction enzyme S subunit n=1 Tax=Roseateles toxinivorans TaxID=270368 RepID=A0A4R6QU97_9BURK|nr:restriction endonuclease subunit S [Roseateles toxinivorans]TDP74055.1 type I restriction enzyme S subunit [Roseateles toxinivorans]